jgi:Ser/Thr protein kinase RdoA (MazF antagonist)
MSLIKSAPNCSIKEAIALVERWYNIRSTATVLPSERDQNFKLSTSNETHYVLKISNTHESKDFLEAQNETMCLVAAEYPKQTVQQGNIHSSPASICQTLVPNIHGSVICTIDIDGKRHFLRLLTWLEGKTLGSMKHKPAGLLSKLGRVMGRIDLALLHFDHPAIHRYWHWDVSNAMREIQRTKHGIRDPERRALIERIFARLEPTWAVQTVNLRQSAIHADANDWNVLVDDEPFTTGPDINGILDWGDIVYSYVVCEPVIAAAYGLLDEPELLDSISQVISGFHTVYPLLENELAVVFDFVCARLCMSVCHSAHQVAERPDDSYLSISEEPAWKALAKLELIDPAFAHRVLLSTCGFVDVLV